MLTRWSLNQNLNLPQFSVCTPPDAASPAVGVSGPADPALLRQLPPHHNAINILVTKYVKISTSIFENIKSEYCDDEETWQQLWREFQLSVRYDTIIVGLDEGKKFLDMHA